MPQRVIDERSANIAPQRSTREAYKEMLNVMEAVILRDIRSRFFNHGLGFLIVPLLPLGHMGILLLVYTVTGRQAVFGEDMLLFFATGIIPALGFSYLSRYMSISLLANKAMTSFPVVKVLDIVLARAFLELMGINLAVMIMVAVLVFAGSDVVPRDPVSAIEAYTLTILLGVGVGMVISVFASIVPFVATVYALFTVIFYLSSDGPIYLGVFPEQIVYAASWNPVFHAVQWLRSAYYPTYPTEFLDKTYLVGWAIGSLVIGLFLERFLRKSILNG
jgi:capsular polysaccharide transport system permease protein